MIPAIENFSGDIIYLSDDDPDPPESALWVLIEEDEGGHWYGTGFGKNADGEESIYISQPHDDSDLSYSLKAAAAWAETNSANVIYIRKRS
ncbi:hypothetical protein L5849_14650 [Erythrobacter sp. SN021]|uniref:hypothetical protein n=1 Tax=Erythrobacter sp. SN021 TaxID=2912574 RepID=UPI001F42699B|nr:hypothetical protein [Erythrobacter sp. SN021]MCF8883939.1 hypothetical protein [Erythrobacter sp. SN021]